jgi:hypothetical protein
LSKKSAIVIIIHKSEISHFEKESFIQCNKIFNNHDIILVFPLVLNISAYTSINNNLIKLPINEGWLKDYESFNRLKINFWFYKKFNCYRNILFYELDAWVFHDELDFWIKSDFDYIGAPWLTVTQHNNVVFKGVGNGGFSLRNVSKHLKLIRSLRLISCLKNFEKFNDFGIIPQLFKLLYLTINSIKTESDLENNFTGQEDIFWTQDLPKILIDFNSKSKILKFLYKILIFKEFKVADFNSAYKFSFEMYPEKLYELNDNKLPFGCHAWQKYNPEFWELHI